jgi:glycosyltransferase involved in cell wall biosynthesis
MKPNLIFIYPQKFTFIKTELRILQNDFKIKQIDLNWSSKLLLPINLIIQFGFLFLNVFKAKVIFISFGGYWSLLPALFGKIFNKKTYIVVHGTDCVDFPQINYGSLRLPQLKFFIKNTYNLVDLILPVSNSLVYSVNTYFAKKEMCFGYKHHFKEINTNNIVIPNGIDTVFWKRDFSVKRNTKSIITVLSKKHFILKGGDLIIELAAKFPNYDFLFAGIEKNEIRCNLDNVKFLGYVSSTELIRLYSSSQFYFQLSLFEGFGVAICEAMLCECIPIVSNVNFLPSIVDDCGFVLEKKNLNLLVNLVNIAINSDYNVLEKKARLRIVNNFSFEKRKKLLLKTLQDEIKLKI